MKLERENLLLSRTVNRIQEESAMLREMFNNANDELTNVRKPALLVAEVVSLLHENKAIIKLLITISWI